VIGLIFFVPIPSDSAEIDTEFAPSGATDEKKWERAVIVYRGQLKHDPKSSDALIGLATALAYTGKRESALDLLIHASTNAKGDSKRMLTQKIHLISRVFLTNKTFQYYQDGLNLIRAQKYRVARESFEKALAEEPNNVEVLLRYGQSQFLTEDYKDAKLQFERAKKLNPLEPIIRLWLGRTNYQLGEFHSALSELKTAHAESPQSEMAAIWLAEALFASGQVHPAIRVLDRDLKGEPRHFSSLVLAARLKLQLAHWEKSMVGMLRRDLQSVLELPSSSFGSEVPQLEKELSLDMRKSELEIKAEIQKLLPQLKIRTEEIGEKT
jgi:tetratricopeptide (TPR) repeat protein